MNLHRAQLFPEVKNRMRYEKDENKRQFVIMNYTEYFRYRES